ncbi:MAG: hypothetical protein L0227_12845, partial [Chloroflexi bacterium]|nr:hypothetical protein [Chloroflexota bacterium]
TKTVTFTVVDGGGGSDSDGDGASDADELAAGTDPYDPASRPGGAAGSGGSEGDDGCGATGLELLLVFLLRRRLLAAFLPILLVAAAPVAALFYEDAGVVSMEAENATSSNGWIVVSGLSGSAMRDNSDRGVGSMNYEIEFTRGGKYYVWLLCRHTSADGASADDCFVTVGGEKLYGSDDVTRPDGMQAASGSFSWSSRPKGPGGTTPSNIAAGPVYALVSGPGRHVFKITSRSKGFEIDKIVLRLDDPTKPTGTGPAETLAPGTSLPPSSPPPPPPSGGTTTPAVGGTGGSPSDNGDHTLNDSLCGASVASAPSGSWWIPALAAGLLMAVHRGARRVLAFLLLGAAVAWADPLPKTFAESEGLVSMEAENASEAKGWEE